MEVVGHESQIDSVQYDSICAEPCASAAAVVVCGDRVFHPANAIGREAGRLIWRHPLSEMCAGDVCEINRVALTVVEVSDCIVRGDRRVGSNNVEEVVRSAAADKGVAAAAAHESVVAAIADATPALTALSCSYDETLSEHTNPLCAAHPDRTSGAVRQVECNSARKRPAVIDDDRNRCPGARVCHRNLRSERQRSMRGGKSGGIEWLTARRSSPGHVVRRDDVLARTTPHRFGVCKEPAESPAMSRWRPHNENG